MDEALEFVSPDIPKWNALIDHKKHRALEDSNTQSQLGYQLADEGRKAAKEGEHTRENPKIMVDAQEIHFRKTHAEKRGVAKSRT